MRLISAIEIEDFRSIQRFSARDLSDYSAFCGLNNSGKSNVLRALSLFFNGVPEPGVPFDLQQDFNAYRARRNRKQRVSVAIHFVLPDFFKFRAGLEPVRKLLGGESSEIKKEWTRDSAQPNVFLNGKMLPLEDALRVEQFLALIQFRYIPNRVMPTEVIRNERAGISASLIRRLKAQKNEDGNFFDQISKQASALLGAIDSEYSATISDFQGVRLATPKGWSDIIFELGYRVPVASQEIDDSYQGSGAQSVLMIETLRMVDQDRYKKFGWKQATIWGFEEPETSLHYSLEAKVASLISDISHQDTARLQIIATTHSNLMLQYSDAAFLVHKQDDTTRCNRLSDPKDFDDVWESGVSAWSHPLLQFPRSPLLLVEGKFDYDIFRAVQGMLPNGLKCRISYLGEIDNEAGTGGKDRLLQYIKNNTRAIDVRVDKAPVIAILDWDAKADLAKYQKASKAEHYYARIWQEGDLNTDLGKTFRGTERALGTNLIKDVCRVNNIAYMLRENKLEILPEDMNVLKKKLNERIVHGDFEVDDMHYVIAFYKRLIGDIQSDNLRGLF
jgi:hypothetical protein